MSGPLTGCTENIRCFLGVKPVIKNTKTGKAAYFDVSWGVNDPQSNKFGTWRHCIAYDQNALIVKDLKPGAYLNISGWITTNPVYNESGIRQYLDGKPVTREYLIIEFVKVIDREKRPQEKQLSLVESGG